MRVSQWTFVLLNAAARRNTWISKWSLYVLYEELFAVDIYLMLFINCYCLIYFLLPCENKLTFASSILYFFHCLFVILLVLIRCGLTNLVQNTVISLCHFWTIQPVIWFTWHTLHVLMHEHLCWYGSLKKWFDWNIRTELLYNFEFIIKVVVIYTLWI